MSKFCQFREEIVLWVWKVDTHREICLFNWKFKTVSQSFTFSSCVFKVRSWCICKVSYQLTGFLWRQCKLVLCKLIAIQLNTAANPPPSHHPLSSHPSKTEEVYSIDNGEREVSALSYSRGSEGQWVGEEMGYLRGGGMHGYVPYPAIW